MPSIWVEVLARNFDEAFGLMDAAVRDCPDALWLASMWEVPDPDDTEVLGAGASLVTDAAERHALVQRHSAPWAVAWHALERLDFIITGGLVPWEVWPPLAERLADGTAAAYPAAPGVTGHTGLDPLRMSPPWSQADLLAYSAYCRGRAADALGGLTEERAATRVGRGTYAWRLSSKTLHVVEHAAQIRQFITAAGVAPHAG